MEGVSMLKAFCFNREAIELDDWWWIKVLVLTFTNILFIINVVKYKILIFIYLFIYFLWYKQWYQQP